MIVNKPSTAVLLVNDDLDNQFLVKQAFAEDQPENAVDCVNDGQEAMDYLLRRQRYSKRNNRLPNLILMDLDLVHQESLHAIGQIKSHPDLKHIPIVVLTTSKPEDDVIGAYEFGANSVIAKPESSDEMTGILHAAGDYWLRHVRLPHSEMDDF